MNLGAVILAGGASRRMGQDKAWLLFDGQPLLVRALATVREAGIEEILISGRAGTDYSALGCPVLFDHENGCGPIAGLQRALEEAQAPQVLVLAVDLPRMTPVFLRRLAARCDALTGVLPRLKGKLEPLAAIYPRRCRYLARDCLLKAHLAARDFAEACLREKAVSLFDVADADAACFENWNTPADVPPPLRKPRKP